MNIKIIDSKLSNINSIKNMIEWIGYEATIIENLRNIKDGDRIILPGIGNFGEATRVDTNIPRWDYFLTQFSVITTYIGLIFFPINQNLDYDFPIFNTLLTPDVFLPFLLLIFISGLGIYMFSISRTHDKAYRIIAFGIFWFFITLSVESSFIPIVDVIFEHRIYLPSVGLFLSLTAVVYLLLNKIRERKLYTIGVSIFVVVIFIPYLISIEAKWLALL